MTLLCQLIHLKKCIFEALSYVALVVSSPLPRPPTSYTNGEETLLVCRCGWEWESVFGHLNLSVALCSIYFCRDLKVWPWHLLEHLFVIKKKHSIKVHSLAFPGVFSPNIMTQSSIHERTPWDRGGNSVDCIIICIILWHLVDWPFTYQLRKR